MKIISWNVNGIRAALKKGFLDFVKKENPDILCLQETKAHPEQVDISLSNYPFHYWNSADKKGYSGTAIFSKIEPKAMTKGNKFFQDNEGRILTLDFDNFYLVNVYTPNSGRGNGILDYRQDWDKNFLKYLKDLEKTKKVIVVGDFNVARSDIELANPKSNYNKTPGYFQVEVDGFEKYVKNGFIDTFREFNKEPGQYTYWSYMFKSRDRNVGWRIDYVLVSKSLMKNVKKSFILRNILGSDHCPVGIELKN
jgi:exodeoxyribonuclease III